MLFRKEMFIVRKHKQGFSENKNEIVACDKFNRAIAGAENDSEISYVPLPKTHKTVVSSCIFQMDSSITVTYGVCLTQFDKSVEDAIYTLVDRTNASNSDDYTYTVRDVAKILRQNDNKNIHIEFLQEISKSLYRLSNTYVKISCEKELAARGIDKKIIKDFPNEEHLLVTSFRTDDTGHETETVVNYPDMIQSFTLIKEPILFRYAMLIKNFELIDGNIYRLPKKLKVTSIRIAVHSYLRDQIILMNRQTIAPIIRYNELIPAVTGRENFSRTEKNRIHTNVKDILKQFSNEGILDPLQPYTEIVEKKGKTTTIVGMKINIYGNDTDLLSLEGEEF